MTELPLVVINVQRGGPSTGLPTKTEQSDLFQAVYGRNGEAPIPVIAPTTPGDCFFATYEACRLAVKYMTPVMVLSDGYLVNGSEPWLIPDPNKLEEFKVEFAQENKDEQFLPYKRDEETLARSWAIPGTKGLEHRIGGLEKQDVTGNVNYDSDNHQKMVQIRAQKIANIANELPETKVFGEKSGDVLILSWGSSCLLYTSDAADDLTRVDLGGRRIIKKKNDETNNLQTERFFFSSRRRHTRFALVSWARRCV